MICYFCRKKYTKKHLCGEFVAYDILKRLFLNVLLDTQPTNGGELYVQTLKRIRRDNLFEESTQIDAAINHYLQYFLQEYDVS